ncbi:hypothetical protein [Streptomyces pyxinicus]|nr:hypothetical protein [Streptomyces sp. LP11]
MRAEESARGTDTEFDRIELVHPPTGLAALDGPHVDYLEPVLRRHTVRT